jgi:hypothetical protein
MKRLWGQKKMLEGAQGGMQVALKIVKRVEKEAHEDG